MKLQQTKPQTLGLIGYGKFGRLMHEILKNCGLQIKIASGSNPVDNKTFFAKADVLNCDIVIPVVPNSAFEATILEIAAVKHPNQLIIDVCSIKSYPKQIMQQHLPADKQIMCTHPMFGPASYAKKGGDIAGFNIVAENVRVNDALYADILAYLRTLKLNVIEISADEHDRLAAKFHFLTNLVGSALKAMHLKRSQIDTASASAMFDFVEMLSTDQELVRDMYMYNPYCREVLAEFDQKYQQILKFITTAP